MTVKYKVDPKKFSTFLTSCGRFDLLGETVASFQRYFDVDRILISEDSENTAAAEQFMVLEFHNADNTEEFLSPVSGVPKPIIKDGFIKVPEGPGLGIESLNDEVIAQHLDPQDQGMWEPTDQYDNDWSNDRLWS